jgi:hypothetical protein
MFVSPEKIIQTVSHSCCFLSLGFNLFYQIIYYKFCKIPVLMVKDDLSHVAAMEG